MRIRLVAILLISLALIGGALQRVPSAKAATSGGAAVAVNKDAVAVIIGNKDYAGSVPDVDFAHNDAEAMKRFVIDVLGFREGNIIYLRDATQAKMETALGNERSHEGKLWRWVKPGISDVLVFYSGHGVPGLKDRRSYLLPTDADPDTPEINGYPVDILYSNLAKLKARSVTVYLDACFSGESPKGMIINSYSAIGVSAKLPAAASGLTVLTAASGTQVASWDEKAKHGLFTNHLLQALHGKADADPFGDGDGTVSLAEVKRYLDGEMTYQARRRFGREQHATSLGSDGIILASLPSEPLPLSHGEITVIEVDLTLRALRNANVRAGPSTKDEKISALSSGSVVAVTGGSRDAIGIAWRWPMAAQATYGCRC